MDISPSSIQNNADIQIGCLRINDFMAGLVEAEIMFTISQNRLNSSLSFTKF